MSWRTRAGRVKKNPPLAPEPERRVCLWQGIGPRYGLRHSSGLPLLVCLTLSTWTAALGAISRALPIASDWVGVTALALSDPGRRTA